MFRLWIFILAFIIPFCAHDGGQGNSNAGLTLVKDIPVSGGSNRFDYQSIDNTGRRLYISHMGSDMVTIFDLDKEIVIADIKDIARPTGILAVPELGKVYVSASRKNELVVIDAKNLKIIQRISTGNFPDGIAYDPVSKKVFVSDEAGRQVTVVDAVQDKLIENIPMGGEVGNTHYDAASHLIYSAVQTTDELVAIDPSADKIVGRYHLDNCKGPHGFYIDSATRYAFISGEDAGQFVVFDLNSTRIIYSDKVGKEPDVLAFDPVYKKLYVSSESGVISVFQIKKGVITKVSQGFIAKHAHTIAVDPQTHLLYLPMENVNGKPVLRVVKDKNQ